MNTIDKPCRTFVIRNIELIKQKVLNWLKQFNTFCLLDNNNYFHHSNYELLVGAGALRSFKSSSHTVLQELQVFINKKPSWLFGHISYDIPTEGHEIKCSKEDNLHYPNCFFFEPEIQIHIKENELFISATNPEKVFKEIQQTIVNENKSIPSIPNIRNKISRESYLKIVGVLQQHIKRGDCYEINFCQEFFSENVQADPIDLYKQLNFISPNPYAALYRLEDKWVICASPERFIKRNGNKIISQPIKGTLPKLDNTKKGINKEREYLRNSEKDKTENVMVVDLVRNDLSRICKKGSVIVEELFGIYTFPQLHQMISTIRGTLKTNIQFCDIINATFPMGSMTGAPKLRVLELIKQYEKSKRGVFSGTIGYIKANGDFDFNVVIRSLMLNETTQYLSYQTGSAITYYSNAEKEWEECLLKAKAINEILRINKKENFL